MTQPTYHVGIVELKPFTYKEWDSYAGAEPFPNGDLPLYGFIEEHGELIADCNGWALYLFDNDHATNIHELLFNTAEEAAEHIRKVYA